MSWDQDVSANEGSAAIVCAVAMDPTEKSFSVEIVPPSLEGWSIGRHYYYSVCTLLSVSDISLESLQLTFSPANAPQSVCSSVTVINDALLEDDIEIICLSLTSGDSEVIIDPDSTCITAVDTSCE